MAFGKNPLFRSLREAFEGDPTDYLVGYREPTLSGRAKRLVQSLLGKAGVKTSVTSSDATRPAGRGTSDVSSGDFSQRFRSDHPIVTGKMVRVQSSNVYAIGYDIQHRELYIRYKDHDGQHPGTKVDKPGPLYKYANVRPQIFLGLLDAASKGVFVWDHLRVRGTISGHQNCEGYELVGVVNEYVPRRATLTSEGEAFVPRSVVTNRGAVLQSKKPELLVRPLRPTTQSPRTRREG